MSPGSQTARKFGVEIRMFVHWNRSGNRGASWTKKEDILLHLERPPRGLYYVV